MQSIATYKVKCIFKSAFRFDDEYNLIFNKDRHKVLGRDRKHRALSLNHREQAVRSIGHE